MIRKYERYKDSGVEWIGEIPEGWEVKKIKYLALGEGTLFLDGDWIESKDIVFDDSQIRYITTGNIGEGKYKEQGLTYITDETFIKLKCTEIFPGDLIISRLNPPIGRCCIVPDLGNRIVTSVDNVVLRPNNHYQKSFLKHVMSNSRYYEYTSLIARGATMQRISRGLLGDVELPITTDNAEQTAIASFLDRKTTEIDQLIANKEKLIALYEEEKTAIINHAVTRGLDPTVKTKPSGIEWLGDIPVHWEVKRLKRLSLKITDGEHISPSFTLEGMPFLSAKDVRDDHLIFANDKFVSFEDGEKFRKRCNPEKNDLLLVSRGATIGRVAIVDTEVEFCLLGSVILIKPSEHIIPAYFMYSLKNKLLQDNFLLTSQSSAQQAIYLVSVVDVGIACPNIDEQTAIVAHIRTECSRLDTIIEKFKKQIELLNEYRTTLISEVVTGKIDVRDEVAA